MTKVIIPSRLPASQSHTKGFGLYACQRGGTFVPPKVPKSGLGQAPRPRRTGTPARNGCAVPKRGLNGAYRVSATHFYRLPRWSAEWRTTTPVPSSKEGDYGASEQTLCGQRLLSSASISPAPSHRDPFYRPFTAGILSLSAVTIPSLDKDIHAFRRRKSALTASSSLEIRKYSCGSLPCHHLIFPRRKVLRSFCAAEMP